MRRYDAVIFDLDGTLLDTAEGICRAVRYTIGKLDLPDPGDEVLRTFIGPPMQISFEKHFGFSKEQAMEAANLFRDRYKESDLLYAVPYDGIYETIKALSEAGVKSCVATYKRQDYADKILVHFGFDRICECICGADFEGKLTKKDIIENAVSHAGITDRRKVVMVGDSDNDAIGAKNAGADFIAAIYGFGFTGEDDAAAYENIGIAKEPKDILRFVL